MTPEAPTMFYWTMVPTIPSYRLRHTVRYLTLRRGPKDEAIQKAESQPDATTKLVAVLTYSNRGSKDLKGVDLSDRSRNWVHRANEMDPERLISAFEGVGISVAA